MTLRVVHSDAYTNLVQALLCARELARLSRKDVAQRMGGIPPENIKDWELLRRQPSASVLLQWAGTVGVEI